MIRYRLPIHNALVLILETISDGTDRGAAPCLQAMGLWAPPPGSRTGRQALSYLQEYIVRFVLMVAVSRGLSRLI